MKRTITLFAVVLVGALGATAPAYAGGAGPAPIFGGQPTLEWSAPFPYTSVEGISRIEIRRSACRRPLIINHLWVDLLTDGEWSRISVGPSPKAHLWRSSQGTISKVALSVPVSPYSNIAAAHSVPQPGGGVFPGMDFVSQITVYCPHRGVKQASQTIPVFSFGETGGEG